MPVWVRPDDKYGMKPICHLNLAPHYRGGERQTELLVRELARRGYSQRLVIKRGNRLATRCADIENLEIREVASNLLAAGLAVKGARIAHAHDGRTVYSVLFANLVYSIPYVITRRVVAPQSKSIFRGLAYRRAVAIAAISRAASVELRKRHPEVQPVVVPDSTAGFAVNQFEVERIRAQRPGKILVGHVGALDHSHKGQSTIIEAARIAATRHPDWHFILCGDGPDEQRFRDEIGALSNIELVGWVENVGDYLASFDLFVYPSLHEALGSTLLDAMQFGLPIVASNVGGIPDLVEDGVNGRLVEPEHVSQLVAGIAELLGTEFDRDEIARRNRARASQFGVSSMAHAYVALYT